MRFFLLWVSREHSLMNRICEWVLDKPPDRVIGASGCDKRCPDGN